MLSRSGLTYYDPRAAKVRLYRPNFTVLKDNKKTSPYVDHVLFHTEMRGGITFSLYPMSSLTKHVFTFSTTFIA